MAIQNNFTPVVKRKLRGQDLYTKQERIGCKHPPHIPDPSGVPCAGWVMDFPGCKHRRATISDPSGVHPEDPPVEMGLRRSPGR